jgi:hypothetical protein
MAYRWKVTLKGDVFDLETVQQELRVSDFRVLEEGGKFHLVGDRFEAIGTNQEVHATAQEVIADLNLSLHLARPDFTSIGFGGAIEERRADGSSVTHQWVYPMGVRARMRLGAAVISQSGEVKPPPPPRPSFPENVMKPFGADENFREAVKAFNAEPKNYKDLYIAYETVRKGVSKSNNYKSLLDLGWATNDELDRFHDTAHPRRHGLPNTKPKKRPDLPELPLSEAVELVRRLLTKWAEMLSANP